MQESHASFSAMLVFSMQYHMNVKHNLLCQINIHHHHLVLKSNVFLRCKKSRPFFFDTTGNMSCLYDIHSCR